MNIHSPISESLALIFQGIHKLRDSYKDKNRLFTIDGRLVGDIGEVIASLDYDIVLDDISQPEYDGTTGKGQRVQIKATFKDHLTFKTVPDFYLGLKLHENGTYSEIYNGPGQYIFDKYSRRKGIGITLLSFPISELKRISSKIIHTEKIQKRSV